MKNKVQRMWNYFLAIEDDLKFTTRFVEPEGQEQVYSLEFTKILLLSCSEIEAVSKLIAVNNGFAEPGNIGQYKELILNKFPGITDAEVYARDIAFKPFKDWQNGKLEWWEAYTDIKHSRVENYRKGNYINATYALGALYLLILYLDKDVEANIYSDQSSYIRSYYSKASLLHAPISKLP